MDKKTYAITELLSILEPALNDLYSLKYENSTAKTAFDIENKVLNDLTVLLAKVKRVSPSEFNEKEFFKSLDDSEKQAEKLKLAVWDFWNPEP